MNNSWGAGGGNPWFADIVRAWRAAGIFPAFANGNSGPACDTSGSPGDYVESYASGGVEATYQGVTVETTTAADGSYTIGLPLGTYPLRIYRGFYASDTTEVTLSGDGEVARHDVALHTARAQLGPESLSFLAQPGQLRSAPLTLRSTSEIPLE